VTLSSLSEAVRRSWAGHRRRVAALAAAAAIAGLLIGVGAWSLLLPGWHGATPGVVEPPAPTALPTEPAVVIPDAPQVGVATTSDVSPFAGIANPLPQPPKRTGLTAYVVQSGDVLWQIADQYHLRPETILWANDIANADVVLVGQKLVIPPVDGVLYTVRPGDRLADVATRYGVDLGAITEANALADADQVQAGQDIFLPGGRPLGPAPSDAAAQVDTANQATAGAGPPVPLPDNIGELLTAGWLQTQETATLYKTPDRNPKPLHDLPPGQRLERLDGFQNGRLEVRDPGDGRTRQAMTGWVDAAALGLGRAPSSRELPLSYPADTAMDIAQVFAPYRTQLDGSPYQEANCGPTAVGMALAAFGVDVPSRQLRAEALGAQRLSGNNVGTLITALASVVGQHGLTPLDLYDPGGGIHRWTVDEIRDHVAQGHPVVVQARYRSLPGRGGAYYYGDHYIMVTGVVPSGFLYNDPIDFDGLGWDRVIGADRLATAMDVADRRYVRSAFAVGR